MYSIMSPGWQSKYSQMLSSVENLIALMFPFLILDILTREMPTASAISCTVQPRLRARSSM